MNISNYRGNANHDLSEIQLIPIRMTIIKNKTITTATQKTSAGVDVEKLETLCIAGRNVKCCSHVEKFLKTLNIDLLFDLAIPFRHKRFGSSDLNK